MKTTIPLEDEMSHATIEYSYMSDIDLEAKQVSDLSGLGALADAVLRDIYRHRDDIGELSDSAALQQAAQLFRVAADQGSSPRQQWAVPSFTASLRRFIAAGVGDVVAVTGVKRPAQAQGLSDLADQFEAVVERRHTKKEIDLIEQELSRIAQGTLWAAQNLASTKDSLHSWLTI